MITIESNVDTFMFSDGNLLFRKISFEDQAVELIEIGGDDSADLSRIIPLIWENGVTICQFAEFFEGKYSEEQIWETVDSLISCGIFSNGPLLEGEFLKPFKLHEIGNGRFFLRIDYYMYFLLVGSLEKAEDFAKRIMCRWGTESNLKLIREAIYGTLKSFPAKSMSCEMIFPMMDSLDALLERAVIEVQLFQAGDKFTLKQDDSFRDARSLNSGRNGYWAEFVERTLESCLISNVREIKTEGKPFELGKFFFASSHILPNIDGKAIHDFQVGLGNSREEACGKALMESLERYCCEKKSDEFLHARAADLSESSLVNPNRLARYLDCQLYYSKDLKNFSVNDEHLWTEISNVEGRSYYIPASHIWYCFSQADFPDGRSLFWSSTNGAAAHFVYEKAVLLAVQEIIERDAILVWWLNRLSPPALDWKLLGEKLNGIIRKIESQGFEINVLDLTLDLLPVCMVVARNRLKKYPYFFCGAACNGDLLAACEKALAETEHTIWDCLGGNIPRKIKAGDLYYPMDHGLFYLDPKNGKNLDFLFGGSLSREMPHAEHLQSVQEVHGYLKKRKFELLLKDITRPEIRESGIDMRVIKAVIPDLIPITFGYLSEPLALPRIYSLPYALGYREKPLTGEEVVLNYQPHFFP